MARPLNPRPVRQAVLALVLVVAASVTGTGATAATTAAEEGCAMPDCFAAVAFNPATGFWATSRNHPTADAARTAAQQACTDERDRPGRCRVLRTTRGATCIGAAMRVRQGAVVAHDTALRRGYRAALTAAEAALDGPQRQRHLITGVCNG